MNWKLQRLICLLFLLFFVSACGSGDGGSDSNLPEGDQEISEYTDTDLDLDAVVEQDIQEEIPEEETDVPTESEQDADLDADDDVTDTAENEESIEQDEDVAEQEELAPPEECDPILASSLGGVPYDFQVDTDNFLLHVARGAGGYQIFGMDDSAHPELLVRVDLPGEAVAIQVEENLAYIAYYEWDLDGFVGGLAIYDIEDPNAPQFVGQAETNRRKPYRDIMIRGDVAYLTNGDTGLAVIDITDKSSPRWFFAILPDRELGDMALVGDTLLIADTTSTLGSLQIVDISDALYPNSTGTYTALESANGLSLWEETLYVADGYGGIVLLDVSTPDSPQPLETISSNSQYVYDVDFDGETLAAAVRGEVLTLTKSEDDYWQTSHRLTARNPRKIKNIGELLVVASNAGYGDRMRWYGSLDLIQLPPEEPARKIGSLPRLDSALSLARWGDTLFVAEAECSVGLPQDCEGSLNLFDVSDENHPQLLSRTSLEEAQDVVVDGEYAYVADGEHGLVILDVQDPMNPVSVTGHNLPGQAVDVALAGDYLFVANGTYGLDVYELGREPFLSYIRHIQASQFIGQVGTSRGTVVFADSRFLYTYSFDELNDLESDEPWQATAQFELIGAPISMHVSNEMAYIGTIGHYLQIVSLADPLNPVSLGTFQFDDEPRDMYKQGDILYVANNLQGLIVLDVSDPSAPFIETRFDTLGYAQDVLFAKGFAAVADDDGGLLLLETRCPCATGYTGGYCELCDESLGFSMAPDGFRCQEDPCLPNPCQDENRSICRSDLWGYPLCFCDDGMREYADGGCRPIAPCASDTTCSEQYRFCMEENGYAVCGNCLPGTHEDDQTCVPDQDCLPTSCAGNGQCEDAGDTVTCTCNEGYALPHCQACDASGGWHLSGDGVTCTQDLCDPDPCNMRGECQAEDGSCICETRFSGEQCESCADSELIWPNCYAEEELTDDFAMIGRGKFTMGSPADEPFRAEYTYDVELLHHVTLTRDFEISQYETTQSEYASLTGWNPSINTSCGSDCPVEGLTWYDMAAYLNRMSIEAGLPTCYEFSNVTCIDDTFVGSDYMSCHNNPTNGIFTATLTLNGISSVYDCLGYRFPTDAEWEYAARAGTQTSFYGGMIDQEWCEEDSLDPYAWYCGNAENQMHPVGQLEPNSWELYDMIGNASEAVWNQWFEGAPVDAIDPENGTSFNRIVRGGAFSSGSQDCRSASRTSTQPPQYSNNTIGFRAARSLQSLSPACDPDPCNGNGLCDPVTGACSCWEGFAGESCDQCEEGRGNYPVCYYSPWVYDIRDDCTIQCYPGDPVTISFNHRYAESWSASVEIYSGSGTPGTVSPSSGTISNSNTVHFTYTPGTGNSGGFQVLLTVEVEGPGGTSSAGKRLYITP